MSLRSRGWVVFLVQIDVSMGSTITRITRNDLAGIIAVLRDTDHSWRRLIFPAIQFTYRCGLDLSEEQLGSRMVQERVGEEI